MPGKQLFSYDPSGLMPGDGWTPPTHTRTLPHSLTLTVLYSAAVTEWLLDVCFAISGTENVDSALSCCLSVVFTLSFGISRD